MKQFHTLKPTPPRNTSVALNDKPSEEPGTALNANKNAKRMAALSYGTKSAKDATRGGTNWAKEHHF